MKCSIKQLRQKTKELVDLAESGEEIIITYRGKEKAMVVPLMRQIEKTNIGFGIWSDHLEIKDSSEFVRKIRKSRIK